LARVKYLGRHIMIKGIFADKLLEGSKSSTIRLGIVKPRYREVIIHGHGRPLAKAVITGVEHKKIRDLTDEDAVRDGFKSRKELLRALRKVYGDFSPEDPVTIIKLRITKRLDNLEASDPYMGLEPADIARLALRYLKDGLGDEERRVLEDLTRTNSIRSTTIRLYKELNKRWRVRRVLRRCLEAMKERGLLGSQRTRLDQP